jgi:hypothetical protein
MCARLLSCSSRTRPSSVRNQSSWKSCDREQIKAYVTFGSSEVHMLNYTKFPPCHFLFINLKLMIHSIFIQITMIYFFGCVLNLYFGLYPAQQVLQ